MGSIVKRAWNGFMRATTGFAGSVLENIQGLAILALTTMGIATVLANWGVGSVMGLAIGAAGSYALAW